MEYTAGRGTTALGIIGTALGGLAVAGGGNLLGGLLGGGQQQCSEDHLVNRYEMAQQAKIAELETEIKLRDANIYTDAKSLDLYKYIDSQLTEIRGELCGQRVHNQRTEDAFLMARQDLASVRDILTEKINAERKERCCADNAIVNYANATFYQRQVSDVTTGTTSTAQALYNPIPSCGGNCCG